MIGDREANIGADTNAYKYYFNNLSESILDDKFEPLFYFITKLFYNLANVELFFSFVNLLFISTILLFTYQSYSGKNKIILALLVIAFMLSSNWYLTAVTNGLRQGLSIPFLFLAFLFIYNKKWLNFIFFMGLAVGFHYSAILFMPFAFLLLIRNFSHFLIVYFFFSIGYLLGFNEFAIKIISDSVGLPVYSMIKKYAGGDGPWNGFYLPFYLYSNFWFLIFAGVFYVFRRRFDPVFLNIVIIYGALITTYHVFGFGPFSNRYAFPAWLFLPIMYAFFIYSIRIKLAYKMAAGLFLMSISLSKFGLFFL